MPERTAHFQRINGTCNQFFLNAFCVGVKFSSSRGKKFLTDESEELLFCNLAIVVSQNIKGFFVFAGVTDQPFVVPAFLVNGVVSSR